MASYIAKNLVAAGLADACQLQLAYAIGGQAGDPGITGSQIIVDT